MSIVSDFERKYSLTSLTKDFILSQLNINGLGCDCHPRSLLKKGTWVFFLKAIKQGKNGFLERQKEFDRIKRN